MSEFAVFAEGLTELTSLDRASEEIKRAAYRAINKVARDSRVKIARKVRNQVNLPARFVAPGSKNLYVSQQATSGSLSATITARGRPTSLSRFVRGTPKVGTAGVHVEVAPGKARFMKRAFLIKLPQGSASIETKYNSGLAIRLRPGERLANKVSSRKVASGLYLLYGPSVDQVFRSRDGTGVATDMIPEIEQDLTTEFFRLLDL